MQEPNPIEPINFIGTYDLQFNKRENKRSNMKQWF